MQNKKTVTAKKFQHLLLEWFDQFGRNDLPWQHNKTPYRVWVSEIMLQQTQVSTVIPYFERFMAHIPDVQTLANLSEDNVFHFWSGLGYYRRARYLREAAIKIVNDFGGQFPDTLETLETLPGVGRSTAGAILAIAFGQRAPILDGNVKRVLTRLHGITEWPGDKKTIAFLWEQAEYYTPTKRCADFTQAIMDLGATQCVRGKPHCTRCPFKQYCIAHREKIAHTLPRTKPKKKLSVKKAALLIVYHKEAVFLVKRPLKGVWSGLWSLPEIPGMPTPTDIRAFCRDAFALSVNDVLFHPSFRHTFSHYHLDILPVFIPLTKKPVNSVDSAQQLWYNLRHSPKLGIPAPVTLLFDALLEKKTWFDSLNAAN